VARRRQWLWGVLALAAAAGVLEAVAAVRVRRLRAERAYLGARLYTEVLGEGDPVVFLAGLPATTRFWGDGFAPLAARRRLVFADALGFGRSPLPDVDYTLDDHLGALRRTLVAKGATRRVTFVAHSFGTLLAAYYAERHPDEVERLVLAGTPVFRDEREARERIRAVSTMNGLFTLNPVLAREACKVHEATFSSLLMRLVPLFLRDVPPEVAQEGLLHTWQSFDGSLRNVLLTKPIAAPLARLGPKVVFVHGRRDRVTPLPRVEELAAAIGARLVVTDDNHSSYPRRSAGPIAAAVLAPAAIPPG